MKSGLGGYRRKKRLSWRRQWKEGRLLMRVEFILAGEVECLLYDP